jgi:5-methyltetrahydrofolate--homocysteine methyltransferase
MDATFEIPLILSFQQCHGSSAALLDSSGQKAMGGVFSPCAGVTAGEDETDWFDALCSRRREQIHALKKGGAAFVLLARQASLAEMRASLLAARGTGLPVAVCPEFSEKGSPERFLAALITLQAMGAAAYGLCGTPSSEMLSAVKGMLPYAAIPFALLADAEPGQSPTAFAESLRSFVEAGVRMIGCGRNTSQEHQLKLQQMLKNYGPLEISKEPDCYAAATEREVFFLGDDIEFSHPLSCSSSLGDKLIRLDDERVSAALVLLESVNDSVLLSQNSLMAKLPIAVRADSSAVLEAALRYFQGRLIIDSSSPIEAEILEPLAAKYGAILY